MKSEIQVTLVRVGWWLSRINFIYPVISLGILAICAGCGQPGAVKLQVPPPPEITVSQPVEREILDFDE